MKIRDETCLRGSFEIRVFKAGREVEHYRDENMIMAQARNALARLIGGDGSGKTVTKIGVGTNGDGPTPDDTGLRDAYAKAVTGCTYPATGKPVSPSPSARPRQTAWRSASSGCFAATARFFPQDARRH